MPEVLDLVDAENERRTIDDVHHPAEAFDDLEGAILALVRVKRGDAFLRKIVQGAAVKILPDALIDARVVALEIEERADDVDVEIVVAEGGGGDDFVGKLHDQAGELVRLQRGFAQVIKGLRGQHAGIFNEAMGDPHQGRLAADDRIERLFERIDQTAEEIIGVVRHVRRHLGVTEIALAGEMSPCTERAHKVRFPCTRLAVEQQDARVHRLAAGHEIEHVLEFSPRVAVHLLDIVGVGAPDVVLPGDRMLESADHLAGPLQFQRVNQHSLLALDTDVMPDGIHVFDRAQFQFGKLVLLAHVGIGQAQKPLPVRVDEQCLEARHVEAPVRVLHRDARPDVRDEGAAVSSPAFGTLAGD